MDIKIAREIVEAGEMLAEIELREDYSGRGMFGEKTTAIVVGSIGNFAAAVAAATAESQDDSAIVQAMMKIRTDNIGNDLVIY